MILHDFQNDLVFVDILLLPDLTIDFRMTCVVFFTGMIKCNVCHQISKIRAA